MQRYNFKTWKSNATCLAMEWIGESDPQDDLILAWSFVSDNLKRKVYMSHLAE